MPDEAFGYVAASALSGQPESQQTFSTGWVPMGDVIAYLEPELTPAGGLFLSNSVKNWPYPVDCSHQMRPDVNGEGPDFHGLVRSGLGGNALMNTPWPNGSGPGIGPQGGPFVKIGPVTGDDEVGLFCMPRVVGSDALRYWQADKPQTWEFGVHPAGSFVPLVQCYDDLVQATDNDVASIEDAKVLFAGPVLTKGTGRRIVRYTIGSPGSSLIEWRRARPYIWRF